MRHQVNIQLVLATLISYEVLVTNHIREHVSCHMAFLCSIMVDGLVQGVMARDLPIRLYTSCRSVPLSGFPIMTQSNVDASMSQEYALAIANAIT